MMTANQKPQGIDAHPPAENHPSADHHSKDDHAPIHPDPVLDDSENGPLHHPESESTPTADHSGHAMNMEHAGSDEHGGHGTAHADHTGHEQMFRRKFWVSLILSIPVIISTGFNVGGIERVATVLVIACPHALGLAIPLVVAITTSIGASNGILIRNRLALEKMRQVAMLTGESQAVAKAVAEELGIDTYFAEVLPEQKDAKVNELQKQGKRVAMVGDGVNDAPALTRADVGIAIGSGTDVAVESAGIILVRSNPLDVVKIIALSLASYRKMTQNLVWAAGYNVVALPLAAGILAPVGILLSPAVGAILMAISTVVVAFNAQLLCNKTL